MRKITLFTLLSALLILQVSGFSQGKRNQQPRGKSNQGKKWHTFTDKCPKECKTCQNKIKQCLQDINKRAHGNLYVCGLAFLAQGSTLTKGTYARKLQEITKQATKFVDRGKYNLNWDIAFVTIFLCEIYLKNPSNDLKQRLKKLYTTIEKRREKSGGWAHTFIATCKSKTWKYTPDLLACTNFISVGLAQLERCGIKVSKDVKKKLAGYYKKCANRNGTFRYSSKNRQSEVARTSGAIFAHMLLKWTDSKIYPNAVKCLKKNLKKILGGHASLNLHRLTTGIVCYKLGKDVWKRYCKEILSTSKYRIVNSNGLDKKFRSAVDAILLQIPYENLSFLKPQVSSE